MSANALSAWTYDASVEKMRPLVARWKDLTAEMLGELHTARLALSNQGTRSDLTSGQMTRSWESYCEAVGLNKRTANRWLERYDAETRTLRAPEPLALPGIRSSLFVKDGHLYVDLEFYGAAHLGTLITDAVPFDEWIKTTTNMEHLEICRDEMLKIARMLAELCLSPGLQAEWDETAEAISSLVDELAKSRTVFAPTGAGWEWMDRYKTMTAGEWRHVGETVGKIWTIGEKKRENQRLGREKAKARREAKARGEGTS